MANNSDYRSATAATAEFKYDPAALAEPSSFRVLRLHPASRLQDSLSFDLEDRSLNDPPRYDAISYTWDDQPFDTESSCSGKTFFITKNCARILSILRRRDRERLVWIDQICINQASDQDRDHNVNLMGKIYSRSRNVMIWTGEVDGRLKDLLCRIVGDHLITISDYDDCEKFFDSKGKSFNVVWLDAIEGYCEDRDVCSVPLYNRFISRPWFHRMWTFQEFVRVKHERIFFMADDSLIWFPRIFDFEASKGFMTSFHIGWLSRFRDTIFNNEPTQWELSDLFEALLNRKCSDPRDKILALYGILKPLLQPSKRKTPQHPVTSEKVSFRFPNLKYTHSVARVYKGAVAWALSTRRDARILYLACFSLLEATEMGRLAAHITPDLPSWVPDLQLLSHLERPFIRYPFQESGPQLFSACSSAPFEFSHPSDNTICLKGIHCATVDYIGSEAQPLSNDDYTARKPERHLYKSISTWMAECRQFYQIHPDFERNIAKFARGTTHFALDEVSEETEAELFEYYALVEFMAKSDGAASADREPGDLEACHQFITKMANRTLLLSERGPLGTGHGQFQLGDHIFAVAGLDELLILRGAGDYYILVGHAYMEGLMQGEAWPKDESALQIIQII